MSRAIKREVRVSSDADKDIERLEKIDRRLSELAYNMLREIAAGTVSGESLEKMPKFGDLSDCRKVYFGYGNPPTHRIVYRIIDETRIEIVEVIAIESRDDAYVYLLTALRLQRLPTETHSEYQSVHQRIIATRAKKKPKK